ncbi:MAG: cob(I)yrinic acid a,c-diamide adenosyltransferase [Hespellia sp.]|nr:cob(I)yrinic acid a,c-diamide adenosyltransferase [Hespellia sp.]
MEEKKMSIYTKSGDRGMTSLKGAQSVSKADDRIQLLGSIDELTSHLGVVKSQEDCVDMIPMLEQIQEKLITVMAGIADSYNQKYRLSQNDVAELEHEIDRLEALFPREKVFVLPGGCKASAELDVARTVTRRAERCMVDVAKRHSIDLMTKQYLNRLSDYLYVNARYVDYLHKSGAVPKMQKHTDAGRSTGLSEEQVVQRVLREIDVVNRISLDSAKKLIELLETYSREHGRKSVMSVCGPDGNMIAVHAMDDAFIASFDISMKKAYTSVAVKMSTMELSKLAQPGQTFYGVDNTDNGKLIIFGGGIPLVYQGKIIGGLGVSGGTGEEDHETAEYGLKMLESIL